MLSRGSTTKEGIDGMSERRSGLAMGFTYFAAVMMIMVGLFHAMNGFAALVHHSFFRTPPDYVFDFSVTTWGWIHLLVGLAIFVAGFGVLSGAVWARTVGVILALVSALAGFTFIPYSPVFGIVFVALDVAVIWALTTHGRDVANYSS
jgi:hypothetical protein